MRTIFRVPNVVAALIMASAVALAGCGANAAPPAATAAPSPTTDISVPAFVTGLRLVESDGTTTSLAALRGKVVILNDILTLCQETCPLDTANIVAAARAVEKAGLGDRVVFLSVTVDPQRDTAAQLAAYRGLYAPAPADWAMLTGAPADLTALWKFFGIYYQRTPEQSPPAKNWRTGATLTYDVAHSDIVLFLDRTGTERYVLDGPAYVPNGAAIPKPILSYMDATGRREIAHATMGSWTVAQVLHAIRWLNR
jgi:protein SCO1/2